MSPHSSEAAPPDPSADSVRLPSWKFINRFATELPGDPDDSVGRRQVFGACHSPSLPTPVANPRLIAHSREMAETLGLTPDDIASPALAKVLGGNLVMPGMRPVAACYGGHQFGHWAGQLGDGRAITLGEVRGTDGGPWELQLKGAGPTPYSRTADGRAVLRSSVREFLCSEAMHHLGVPTTRALSLVTTGDLVRRDMFYDGHPADEPGAIVCRVAPSFLRFGNFEIFNSRRDTETLRQLADFAIRHYFPQFSSDGAPNYVGMLTEVCRTTAIMIAEWMRVGFVHGVMNTDNMSLLGLTIDYGPYGWLEPYDPSWTPNTTDAQGRRYAFGRQPQIAGWNLTRFAEALYPLVGDAKPLETALETYLATLDAEQNKHFAAKLGLDALRGDDRELVGDLLELLASTETDMTIFYRSLADVGVDGDPAALSDAELAEPLRVANYGFNGVGGVDGNSEDDDESFEKRRAPELAQWLRRYLARVHDAGIDNQLRRQRMNAANPKYVPRNYLVHLAIERAEAGDPSMIGELLDVFRSPYDEQPEREAWAAKRPEWARSKAGCSMLSCSS